MPTNLRGGDTVGAFGLRRGTAAGAIRLTDRVVRLADARGVAGAVDGDPHDAFARGGVEARGEDGPDRGFPLDRGVGVDRLVVMCGAIAEDHGAPDPLIKIKGQGVGGDALDLAALVFEVGQNGRDQLEHGTAGLAGTVEDDRAVQRGIGTEQVHARAIARFRAGGHTGA